MKIILINSAEIELSPYISSYLNYFSSFPNIKYYIAEWRRDIPKGANSNDNVFSYTKASPISSNKFKKLLDYYHYSIFVKQLIKTHKFDRIIVFDLQISFFLKNFLIRKYRNKYIIDIRDYIPLYPYIRTQLKTFFNCAYSRVISSEGYKEWLIPSSNEYICHNVNKDDINDKLIESNSFNKKFITILTIGCLRTFDVDSAIIRLLSSHSNVKMVFAGTGIAEERLKAFSKNYSNVSFLGKYNKNEEQYIAINSDFINILLDNSISYRTAMANRFYLSILIGRPMIVSEGGIQASYVKKYKLGIIINNREDCYKQIMEYIDNYDPVEYTRGRKEILLKIKDDISSFEKMLNNFIK